jgi:hypothetical protein
MRGLLQGYYLLDMDRRTAVHNFIGLHNNATPEGVAIARALQARYGVPASSRSASVFLYLSIPEANAIDHILYLCLYNHYLVHIVRLLDVFVPATV